MIAALTNLRKETELQEDNIKNFERHINMAVGEIAATDAFIQ